MKIEIPISCGELVDKLTILEIKGQHITESEKLNEVKKEFKDASGQVKNIDVKLFPWEELNYVDKVKSTFNL